MPSQVQTLLEAGSWSADVLEANWQESYAQMIEYAAENHGNANVPQRYSTPARHNLGNWVQTQRRTFNNGSMLLSQ